MDVLNMDPNILLSIINLKLRDYYSNLDSLCEDMDINKEILEKRLKEIDYIYDGDKNQFK
ncbi:DUF4250 domain-containing protein [Clostridium chrysemydis]|uniref:DUF4250 domain-containing protein n=1 Tax=Clostridium chrysemydis TaxID=2665504 RepID=UPI0018833E09|nr:DUF4250 domain-containing protein [Clostridium chrysemydis]